VVSACVEYPLNVFPSLRSSGADAEIGEWVIFAMHSFLTEAFIRAARAQLRGRVESGISRP
jgi:hypothetical protein